MKCFFPVIISPSSAHNGVLIPSMKRIVFYFCCCWTFNAFLMFSYIISIRKKNLFDLKQLRWGLFFLFFFFGFTNKPFPDPTRCIYGVCGSRLICIKLTSDMHAEIPFICEKAQTHYYNKDVSQTRNLNFPFNVVWVFLYVYTVLSVFMSSVGLLHYKVQFSITILFVFYSCFVFPVYLLFATIFFCTWKNKDTNNKFSSVF